MSLHAYSRQLAALYQAALGLEPPAAKATPAAQPSLRRHARRAHRLRERLAEAHGAQAMVQYALDVWPLGVIVVDDSNRVVTMNRQAEAMTHDDGCVLNVQHGLLVARPVENAADLHSAIHGAISSDSKTFGRFSTIRLIGPSFHSSLRVQVTPLGPWRSFRHGAHNLCAVLLKRADGASGLDPKALADRLGLTRMQSSVALMLMQGKVVSAIATALGKSKATVRTHVRMLLRKSGTHRQAEFISLVLNDSLLRLPGHGRSQPSRRSP